MEAVGHNTVAMKKITAPAPAYSSAIRERLALNMIRMRTERGWPQEALALEAGLRETVIADVERQARSISLLHVDQVACAFGISIKELLRPQDS